MSKLQVETISHTNNTTGMTISSGGVVDTPKQENRYELLLRLITVNQTVVLELLVAQVIRLI